MLILLKFTYLVKISSPQITKSWTICHFLENFWLRSWLTTNYTFYMSLERFRLRMKCGNFERVSEICFIQIDICETKSIIIMYCNPHHTINQCIYPLLVSILKLQCEKEIGSCLLFMIYLLPLHDLFFGNFKLFYPKFLILWKYCYLRQRRDFSMCSNT